MKLSDYAKNNNISYKTAWRHFKAGKLNATQLQTGTVVIKETNNLIKPDYIVTYARVSSSENKSNLKSQSNRLVSFCNANGWIVKETIEEIGSGLNDNRKKLMKLLESKLPTKIVIEHKDRLTRFGFNYLNLLCKNINCDIIIINESASDKEDLIQDFISIITSFCARIYGQRRTKRQTEKLIKELENE